MPSKTGQTATDGSSASVLRKEPPGYLSRLFHRFYEAPFGYALQDTECEPGLCHGVRKAHDNECGTLLPGGVQQCSDQFGGAVVQLGGGAREIEDHDIVALDVRADDIHELPGGRHGETSLEPHQPDPR